MSALLRACATAFVLALVTASSVRAQEIQYTYDADGRLITQGPSIAGLAINGFAPLFGSANASVSIQGQGFDPIPANNEVSFGGVRATIVSAGPDLIVATVPVSAVTGPIALTVAGKTAQTARDFIVLPAGSDANGLVSASLLPLDGTTHSLASLASRGYALSYRLAPNDLASLDFSMGSCSGLTAAGLTYKVYGPASTLLGSGTLTATSPTYLSATGASAGTYTLVLSASQPWTCDVAGQLDPTVATGGDGLVFETVKPYQLRRIAFDLPSGGALSVASTDVNTTPVNGALTIRFYGPDGLGAGSYSCGYIGYNGTCQGQLIYRPPGRYTAVIQPWDSRTSLVRSKFWVQPYVDGGVFSIGSTVNVSIAKPGQVVRYTIPGHVGDQPHLSFSNRVFTGVGAWGDELTGKNPTGGCIFDNNSSCTIGSSPTSPYHFAPLKYEGNYTLLYYLRSSGTGAPTGSISLTLAPTTKTEIPAATESDTVFATSITAQVIQASMTIAQGEDLSLAATELVTSPAKLMVSVTVTNAAGSQVASFRCGFTLDPCMTMLRSLPAGTYTVTMAPYDYRTATFSLRLWRTPFTDSATLPPNTTAPVNVKRPGQVVRYRIDGGVGRLFHIVTNGVAWSGDVSGMTTTIRNPGAGCYDANASCTISASGGYTVYDLTPLRASGPYEILSYMTSTGYAAPTANGSLSFSETKVTPPPQMPGPMPVANDIDGQNVRVPITVAQGSDMALGMTDLLPPSAQIIALSGSLIRADGTIAKTLRCGYDGSCAMNTIGMPAGQYTLEFRSTDSRSHLFSFNLWTTNVVDGGYLTPGSSSMATVSVPGQITRFKIAAHAGQKLHLSLTGAVLASDAARVELSGVQADGKCAFAGAGTSCIAAVSTAGYDIPAPIQDGDLTFVFYAVGKGISAPKGSATLSVTIAN